MSGYGKDAVPVTTQTTKARRDYLDLRAARMGWSRADVVSRILAGWFEQGAPGLSDAERQLGIAPLPASALTGKQS